MRLRNIPGARERIEQSAYCVNEPEKHKGRWSEYFGSSGPVYIEIGMGKGKFITRMAKVCPDINFIGIEMYSSVLLRAAQHAEALKAAGEAPENFAFIRMDARYLNDVFGPGEVWKIYLNFSDPWPKARHAKRRLTSINFLRIYETILPQGGEVEFKTDNQELFEFSLEQASDAGWELLESTRDLHGCAKLMSGNIMSEYEERFAGLGEKINKMIIAKPG